MNKAIIVEVSKRHLIVLAEGGEFKKVKNTNAAYAVGQEITLPLVHEKKSSIFSILVNWKTGTAVALAIFLLFFQVLSPLSGQGAYAYVGMDMDPSLELKIDEDMKVLEIAAFNQQGHNVLDHMPDWEKKDIAYVTSLIFETCEDLGYLKTQEEVLITTTLSEEIPEDMEKEMKQRVNEVMTNTAKKKSVEMTTIVMSSKEREQSKKMNMSPGHYAIYTAAKKSGIKITKNEISGQTIEEISEKVGPIKELLKEEEKIVNASAEESADLVYEPPLPILDEKEQDEKTKKEIPILPVYEKVDEAQKKKPIQSQTSHVVISHNEEHPAAELKKEDKEEKQVKPNSPSAVVSVHGKETSKPPQKDVPAAIVPPRDETHKEEKPKEVKPKEDRPKEEKPKEDKPKEAENPPNPVEEPVLIDPEPTSEPKEDCFYIEIIMDGIVIEVRMKTDSQVISEELYKQAISLNNQNSSDPVMQESSVPTEAITQQAS
ncbi:anti-sigma factor domain-containing protein [Fictibacillus barbaricus]|uniref:Anti-sigma factor domain-containing protein n=1 Tax=Fictibacillus barbaricus TaxID=182136 RepID=A0ABS2ZHI5_9BACL|nr:anti-sigma factor domain-containing protein [Fictibacillus barbaricus]MBN3547137.1 anti-sigma factor domain-containing protein [Fictibacillus barbaricus]GGB46700.1 hypothetical protein GCM10007199_10140 [Fictibacillus barbaricus]